MKRLWLILSGSLALAAVAAVSSAPQGDAPARAAAAALPRLHTLVVSQRGQIVFEYYAKGHSPTRLANIKSASKSIIAALVGIAIDRKLIPGVKEPIVRWFPELRKDPDPRKQKITIEDLLTMRSGLASTSGDQYGRWVSSANWVRYALARPMVSDPGTSMEYSTGTSHILSAILTRAGGRSTHQFAVDTLARPLGITLARWTRDPQGIYMGGNEMLMTPRQMIAVGELWRNRGHAGDRQVVSSDWVDTSCVPRTRSRWDGDREYGYGWWSQDFGGHRACFAWGLAASTSSSSATSTSSSASRLQPRGANSGPAFGPQLFNLLQQHLLVGGPPPRKNLPGRPVPTERKTP